MGNLYRYTTEFILRIPPWDDDGRSVQFCVFDPGSKHEARKAWLVADHKAEANARFGAAVRAVVEEYAKRRGGRLFPTADQALQMMWVPGAVDDTIWLGNELANILVEAANG